MSGERGLSPRRAIRLGDAEARKRARDRLKRRRRMHQLISAIGHGLGFRHSVVVEGVRYTERDLTPIAQALAPGGAGSKEYFVRFPDGSAMRIRCHSGRVYADLMPDPRQATYERLLPFIKPGMRVLEVGAGTGAGSAHVAWAVGPSGGVIALERDPESVRFARRRYATSHLAFERGGLETLRGELDGSFDVAIVRTSEVESPGGLREIYRCLAPEGWAVLWNQPALDRSMPMIREGLKLDHQFLGNDTLLIRKPAEASKPRVNGSNLDQ